MYRGKKFNSRKEDMPGEDYMGIRKFRFYIKCSVCSAEITFCTDPKNSDYECESGALRNFEMWRENDKIVEEDEKVRQEEDKIDAMKALENRTLDSKVEMDVLDALDEIQAINQRHERVDTNAVLDSLFERTAASAVDRTILASGVTQADEELIKSIKFKNAVNMNETMPRIVEDNDAFIDSSSSKVDGVALSIINQMQKRNAEISTQQSGIAEVKIIPKRKAKIPDKSEAIDGLEPGKKQKVAAVIAPAEVKQVVGLGALMAYGSDDSD